MASVRSPREHYQAPEKKLIGQVILNVQTETPGFKRSPVKKPLSQLEISHHWEEDLSFRIYFSHFESTLLKLKGNNVTHSW